MIEVHGSQTHQVLAPVKLATLARGPVRSISVKADVRNSRGIVLEGPEKIMLWPGESVTLYDADVLVSPERRGDSIEVTYVRAGVEEATNG